MVRVVDLKVGDKFYGMDWDDEDVYELLNLKIIHGNDSIVEYGVRKVGSKTIFQHKMDGDGVVNRILRNVLKFIILVIRYI